MKIKQYLTAFSLAMAVSLLGYGGQPARAEEPNTIEIKKEYEAFDQDEDISTLFEPEIERDGKKYRLLDVEKHLISSWPEIELKTITIQTDPTYDVDSDLSLPAETIEQDGMTYYLTESDILAAVSEARTEYGKTTITFHDLEYVDEIPGMGEVVVTDSITGKEYVRSLPRSGYTVVGEQWLDDFTFPITIYSIDADYYMLANTRVPKGSDLSQYSDDFLLYLGLDTEFYQVTNVRLQGEPYEANGELVQDAIASGRRRTVDVAATYEGSITIPQETAWYWDCLYSNAQPDEEVRTIYSMQATGIYEQLEASKEEVPVKSTWRQLVDWIITHPIISVVIGFAILSGLLAAILLFLARKRDGGDEYD